MDNFRTMISAVDIQRRIGELAVAIAAAYPDGAPVVVGVIEGARRFGCELLSRLPWPDEMHEIRASSYGDGTNSSGEVQLVGGERIPIEGQSLLLLEDIVDTGRTIAHLDTYFRSRGAAEVRVASLLSKPSRRVVEVEIDFLGFEIADEFVIGFGMDYAGRFRDLDRVAVYEAAAEHEVR
jgi:hypoxanthine phosphoribosyltransferase